MRICIIGTSGHSQTILPQLDSPEVFPLTICGYCKGFDGERTSGLEQKLFVDRKMQIPRFDSYLEMFDQTKPDLAVIDGMFCDHAKMAIEALKRGIHVYMDKPVATTLEDLEALRKAAAESSAKLGAMFTTRYEPAYYTARQLIREGVIGQVRLINAQKSYRLGKRPEFFSHRDQFGGLTPWVSIHMLDMILWLTGKKCRSVFSRHNSACNYGNGDLEMISLCNLELEDDILASVNTDYYRPAAAPTHGDDRIRIVGTDGILEIIDEKLSIIDANGPRMIDPLPTPDLFGEFLRRIQQNLPADDGDGLYSTYICLKLRDSADQGIALSLED
ncbi:MAG: Gfo/Idh/MocA family protein [Candidatus Merdivicinus sp.]|jgi:predicted dehydrogenase